MRETDLKTLLQEEVKLPRRVYRVPSMQTGAEKQLLYNLASKYFSNQGLIFDSGLYLGVSTLCFGLGLRNNPHLDLKNLILKPIQSFELGICTQGIAQKINKAYPEILRMQEGDSFLPLLRKNIKEVEPLVRLYEGDITQWLPQIPSYNYEIVFLDVLKKAEVNDSVIKHIFPKLIPGQTIVVQQDFTTPNLPWIQVSMGFFKDYFKYLFTCGTSAVYLSTKPISTDLAEKCVYNSFSGEEMLELFNKAIPQDLSGVARYKMELAKALAIAQKIDLQEGIQYAEGLRERHRILAEEKPWLKSVDQFIPYIKKQVMS